MKGNIAGKVGNTKLRKSDYLLPLKEAVSNSIHSTRTLGSAGRINIFIRRKDGTMLEDSGYKEIIGFDVVDNGIGFTPENYESFNTMESTLKRDLGGKGIGRFTWLVAFDNVEVESWYGNGNSQPSYRAFTFREDIPDGVKPHTVTKKFEGQGLETKVSLNGYRERYREECPKKAETIAQELAMHFLSELLSNDCPRIVVKCNDRGEAFDLKDNILRPSQAPISQVRGAGNSQDTGSFKVGADTFNLSLLALDSRLVDSPRMLWLAHHQVVGQQEFLSPKLKDLPTKLPLSDGSRDVAVIALLSSTVLDNAVDTLRGQFTLDSEQSNTKQGSTFQAVTEEKIRTGALAKIRELLSPIIEQARKEKDASVEAFFETPQGLAYRSLPQVRKEVLDSLPHGAKPDRIENEFADKFLAHCRETRRLGQEVLPSLSQPVTEELKGRFEKYKQELLDTNRVKLAEYVAWRRSILDVATAVIAKASDGTFHYEKELHNLVFPMRLSGEGVEYRDHNLWLLDERLALFSFLYSDMPIKSMPAIEGSASKEEPDILCVSNGAEHEFMLFSEQEEIPLTNVALIEFKRASDAQSVSEKSNPLHQLARYVTELRKGTMRFTAGTRKGQKIVVSKSARFWCYAVCEINQEIKDTARLFSLTTVEEDMRSCGYHLGYEAYFDVMSFSCFIREATARNAAFLKEAGFTTK